jgi:hypothetical protein
MSEVTKHRKVPRLGPLQLAILLLALATALIHLYLAIGMGHGGPGGRPPGGNGQAAISGTPGASMTGTPPAGITGNPPAGATGAPSGASGFRGAGGPPGGGSFIMRLIPLPLSTLFILNFIGYIVLAAALYLVPPLQRFQPIIRWLLIAYTAVTVILWYLYTGGRLELDDVSDKLIEVALIVLLLIDTGLFHRRKPYVKPAS